jgi:ABC-type Zn uptake system ZnuABC Zn-binding protein ZnuA
MEADARKMAELVKTCQEQKVSAICIEPQYSRKAAEALASQLQHLKADVRLVEVDPLETAPGSPNPDPSYYLERMRQNIDQLAKALP